MGRRKTERKIPTQADYEAYDGEHCCNVWKRLGDNWRCPGCDRTKFQIMRWTRKIWDGRGPTVWHDGWKAVIHGHHDHLCGYITTAKARFPQTLVCDHCNVVDAAVKRKFPGQIHAEFSFSPSEIRQIVIALPHREHIIEYGVAKSIYDELLQTGRVRTSFGFDELTGMASR